VFRGCVVVRDLRVDAPVVLDYAQALEGVGRGLRGVSFEKVRVSDAEAGCAGVSEAVEALRVACVKAVVGSAVVVEMTAVQVASGVRGVTAGDVSAGSGFDAGGIHGGRGLPVQGMELSR
jgi:hypothetical protein